MKKHTLFCGAAIAALLARCVTSCVPARALAINDLEQARAYDFYSHGPYRKGVPRPSALLGYEIGETHSTYRDQERVLLAIASAAKDRVRLIEYGKSVEGRPLRLAIVSAPENLAKLDAVRSQIAKLADPRTLADPSEADRIVHSAPVITWINHCIHGDETASFESAMWLFYTLSASESDDIREALSRSIVILNPVFNPDGHERFVVHYNSIAVGSPEGFALEKETPWTAVGRFNHYRFDMNRDKLAQSQGRVARAFLEPDADFEPEFVKEQLALRDSNEKKNDNERKESYGFYDITAWSLPYAYGLEAYWTEDAPAVPSRPVELDARGEVALPDTTGGVQGGAAQVAYLWRYDRDAAAFLALRLLQEDYKLAVVTKPIRIEGKEWPRGTLVARVVRNPESLLKRLGELSKALGVPVFAVRTGYGDENSGGLGSEHVENVSKPSIAVVGDAGVSHTSFGAVWYLLERQAGVKFTSLSLRSLASADLTRFNVIVLPDGGGYSRTLGKGGMDVLKEWVGRGGALIGLRGGGLWFIDKEASLTSATEVGGDETETKPDDHPPTTKPDEKAKPKKPVEVPGAIFRATVDATHFLGYGYENGDIAVPLGGATFLKPSRKGADVVTFGKMNLKLSGFVWPDNTERFLAGTAYVIDEPHGDGHAILFLDDPTFRGFWLGLRRMFLSGILFAPSRPALAPARRERE